MVQKYRKNGTEITSDTVGSDLFLTADDYSVRMLTLPEINNDRSTSKSITSQDTIFSKDEPAVGLYVLQNIKNISGLSSYTYSDSDYWLASPAVSNSYYVCDVAENGNVSGTSGSVTYRVRPVVNLGSDITYTVDSDTDETGITYLILTPEA